MAVGPRIERPSARWLTVKRGVLLDKKSGEELGWVSGIVAGVRVVKNERYGHLELNVKIVNEGEEDVIIAGGMTNPDKSCSTWSRMLVGRLVSKKNDLEPVESVRVEFYPLETAYGETTGVALYRDGSNIRLRSARIEAADQGTMARAVLWLVERFPWGGARSLPEGFSERGMLGAGDPDAEDADWSNETGGEGEEGGETLGTQSLPSKDVHDSGRRSQWDEIEEGLRRDQTQKRTPEDVAAAAERVARGARSGR